MDNLEYSNMLSNQLKALDEESIRPLRAIILGEGSCYDFKKLRALEEKAKKIREELIEMYKE